MTGQDIVGGGDDVAGGAVDGFTPIVGLLDDVEPGVTTEKYVQP